MLEAVCETVHRPKIFADRIVVHAVTGNFLHCKLVFGTNEKLPEPGSLIKVKILRPLSKNEISGESDTLAVLEENS